MLLVLVLVESEVGSNKRSVVDCAVVTLDHEAIHTEHRLQVGPKATLGTEPVWREEGHVIQLEFDEGPLCQRLCTHSELFLLRQAVHFLGLSVEAFFVILAPLLVGLNRLLCTLAGRLLDGLLNFLNLLHPFHLLGLVGLLHIYGLDFALILIWIDGDFSPAANLFGYLKRGLYFFEDYFFGAGHLGRNFANEWCLFLGKAFRGKMQIEMIIN